MILGATLVIRRCEADGQTKLAHSVTRSWRRSLQHLPMPTQLLRLHRISIQLLREIELREEERTSETDQYP